MDLRDLIESALERAWQQFQIETTTVEAELFDESTFRFLFLRALRSKDTKAICRTEWGRRVDLFVSQTAGQPGAAIEFKFYVYRFHYGLECNRMRPKGGPGPKNAQEFTACLSKLAALSSADISAKYLIVVYQKDQQPKWKHSYDQSYDMIDGTAIVPNGCQVVRVRKLPNFLSERTPCELCCKVIQVA
jgi:hypothetical protein